MQTDTWSFTRGDTRIRGYLPPVPTGSPPEYLEQLLATLGGPEVAAKVQIKADPDGGVIGKAIVRVTAERVEVEISAALSRRLPNRAVADVQFSWTKASELQVYTLVRIELRPEWQVTT